MRKAKVKVKIKKTGLFKWHKPEIHTLCENVTGNHPGVGVEDPTPLKIQEPITKLFTWDEGLRRACI